jgi:hypothetical protein
MSWKVIVPVRTPDPIHEELSMTGEDFDKKLDDPPDASDPAPDHVTFEMGMVSTDAPDPEVKSWSAMTVKVGEALCEVRISAVTEMAPSSAET